MQDSDEFDYLVCMDSMAVQSLQVLIQIDVYRQDEQVVFV